MFWIVWETCGKESDSSGALESSELILYKAIKLRFAYVRQLLTPPSDRFWFIEESQWTRIRRIMEWSNQWLRTTPKERHYIIMEWTRNMESDSSSAVSLIDKEGMNVVSPTFFGFFSNLPNWGFISLMSTKSSEKASLKEGILFRFR